ncbi:pilus assembly protein [Lysinibacillus sp. BW-2-10]|uniref:pilus assembly protein n=1 Tax=Lysinibacillus sp. BW-2-10 TaxID=2590030 RepID=UPI00117E44CB|nr:pilus assembly protein [Lysinibacillus sp. BW-2-10]TSI04276.1 pilus assembly protein [Lysinibacillus sp. BW-2-10]
MKVKKLLNNEKGSLSIEFLGILPFYFLFFLILWQVVASGYAVLNLKAAATDAAQVYAMSKDYWETKDTIDQTIGSGSLLTDHSFLIEPDSADPNFFVITVTAKHPLVFLPESMADLATITIDSKATGKVFVP